MRKNDLIKQLQEIKGNPEVEELERRHKTEIQWELNEYVSEEDIAKKRYTKKSVVFLQAKKRGISTFDRAGSIQY